MPNLGEDTLTPTQQIIVRPNGADYVLERTDTSGAVSSLRLSLGDILDLARYFPQYARENLSALTPTAQVAGMKSVAASRLVHARANVDALGEVILLTLQDDLGLEPTYAIEPGLCLEMSRSLVSIAETTIAKKTGGDRAN